MFQSKHPSFCATGVLAISLAAPNAFSEQSTVDEAERLLSELSPGQRSLFLSSLKDKQTLKQLGELVNRMDDAEIERLLRPNPSSKSKQEVGLRSNNHKHPDALGLTRSGVRVAKSSTSRAIDEPKYMAPMEWRDASPLEMRLSSISLAKGAGDGAGTPAAVAPAVVPAVVPAVATEGVFTKSTELDEKLGMKPKNRILDTKWAYRWEAIRPTSRVFFDTGNDNEGEIDLFQDGKASVQLQFLTLGVERAIFGDSAIFYPNVGIGMSSISDDETDSELAVALSAGLSMEFVVQDKQRVGVEVGYMHAFTPDEGLADSDDGALFVGLTFGKGLFSNGD